MLKTNIWPQVESLIKRHEALKMKWLQLNEQDIHDWLDVCDEMNDLIIELESMYLEEDEALDKDRNLRFLELKEQTTEDWKKINTDAIAKAKADIELFDRRIDQIYIKETIERLKKKSKVIEHYQNIWKFYMRKDFSI